MAEFITEYSKARRRQRKACRADFAEKATVEFSRNMKTGTCGGRCTFEVQTIDTEFQPTMALL